MYPAGSEKQEKKTFLLFSQQKSLLACDAVSWFQGPEVFPRPPVLGERRGRTRLEKQPQGSRRCRGGGGAEARPLPFGAARRRRGEANCQSAERRPLICCRLASRGSGLPVYNSGRGKGPPPFCPVRKSGAGVSLRVESATNLARAPFARPPS